MPITISARVAPETAEQLRERAREEDRTVSDVVNRAIIEYLRAMRFPGIVFVTGGRGRRKAKLTGGPDVWEVVFVAQEYGMDAEKTAAHLAIPAATARLALAYYAAYPDEINARLKRMADFADAPERYAPGIRVFTVPDEADAPPA